MKKILHIALLLTTLGVSSLFAQQRTDLNGAVTDSSGKALPSSTVVLLDGKDSTLLKFTITDNAGAFTLKGVDPGHYIMQISYLGYKSTSRQLDVKGEKETTDLGMLVLAEDKIMLGSTTIEGQRIPILFKEDTVEYNAASFKPKANDAVEKLLKKLPGVEVDEDGTVKAQGEEVKKVLVDGKEFFGDDPKVATKNLPADAIAKVQVYDKMSDVSEFTGVDDGERQKVINLMLKEGRKNGYFGNAMAGGGTEERYQGKLNLHRFTKETQTSFIGMANNTNEQGFSARDYINFMGGLGNLMRGGGGRAFTRADIPVAQGIGNGYINTQAGGVNFNHHFSKNTDLNLSYFYNGINGNADQTTYKQSFAETNQYTSNEQASSDQRSGNHRISMLLKHEFDSTADLQVRGALKYNDGKSNAETYIRNYTLNDVPVALTTNDNNSRGNDLNGNLGVTHRKKLKKDGRTLVTELTYSGRKGDSNGELLSHNGYYVDSLGSWLNDTIWQNQQSITQQQTYGGKLTYTEPLGNRRYLQVTGDHNRKTDISTKRFYDLYNQPYYQEILNPMLSNEFNSDFFYNRGGVNYMLNRTQYNFSAGVDAQYAFLKGEVTNTKATVSKEFRSLLPSVNFGYRFNNSKRLNIRYRTQINEPSVDQLQPVTDNSNPLNIYMGNPYLKAEYSQTLSMRYMAFSQFNFTSFFANLQATYTGNKITNAVNVDQYFRQVTQPVNVDQYFNTNGYLSYSMPVKYIKAKLNLSSNLMYTHNIQFVNTRQDNLNRFTNGYEVSVENLKKGKLDLEGGVRITQNLTYYEINDNFNQRFLTNKYFANADVDFLKTWRVESNLAYTVYTGDAFSVTQQVPILGASLSKKFLKNDKGELKLAVIDILNRNTGITRTSDVNYIEEQQVETLGRYGLLTFTYNFRALGRKSKSSERTEGDG